jgi:predicted DNA-binding protein with PD1-like motif
MKTRQNNKESKADKLTMRRIVQPGPPASERIQWVEARGRAFSFTLQAGLPLLEAARRGFAAEGFAGGTLNIMEGALGPFAYVMPALAKTGENAAFYSDTFRPAGVTRLRMAAMTLGQRDGAPFFHCHALWTEADGRAGGGHILPEETVVAEPFAVEALGLDGAAFAAEPDPETNFKLFGPIPSAVTGAEATSRVFALRLRPNQDFAGALEAFCRERGIISAKLHGGVGSIIGARFADGRIVEPFATEMAVRSGAIVSGAGGALEAELDIALVDYLGGLAEGRLTRGDNPVLMTMELLVEVLEERRAQ